MVIPKALRDEAGLCAGAEVDVVFRDGRIEIEPATVPMRLVEQGHVTTIDARTEMPVLTSDDVRDVLERVRR
jgi:AbrB family looped-hinge helix DNA binding protein